jgi:hypothetical protein
LPLPRRGQNDDYTSSFSDCREAWTIRKSSKVHAIHLREGGCLGSDKKRYCEALPIDFPLPARVKDRRAVDAMCSISDKGLVWFLSTRLCHIHAFPPTSSSVCPSLRNLLRLKVSCGHCTMIMALVDPKDLVRSV